MADGEGVEHRPVAAEGLEEAGPDGHPDGVDEQDQPEVLGEVAHLGIDLEAEVAERQADEQRPGDAEPDRPQPGLAERQSEHRHHREDHDGVAHPVAAHE